MKNCVVRSACGKREYNSINKNINVKLIKASATISKIKTLSNLFNRNFMTRTHTNTLTHTPSYPRTHPHTHTLTHTLTCAPTTYMYT